MKKKDEFALTILYNETTASIAMVGTSDLATCTNETKYDNIDLLWYKSYISFMQHKCIISSKSQNKFT